MSSQLVWLVTGTSSGIGRQIVEAALKRGDKVIATARAKSFSQLDDLKAKGADVLELDVTYSRAKLNEIAKAALALHGRVDVLVNNAGFYLAGSIEENTEEETLEQFNTNFFGALSVTRAFLPSMRERKSGTIIFIGSMGGWTASANSGLYCASKAALRATTVALSQEVGPLGIRVSMVDLGIFRTKVLLPGNRGPPIMRIPDYAPVIGYVESMLEAAIGNEPGDPAKAGQALVDLVHGEGLFKGKEFPASLALGTDMLNLAKNVSQTYLTRLDDYAEISKSTDFESGKGYDLNEWRDQKGY